MVLEEFLSVLQKIIDTAQKRTATLSMAGQSQPSASLVGSHGHYSGQYHALASQVSMLHCYYSCKVSISQRLFHEELLLQKLTPKLITNFCGYVMCCTSCSNHHGHGRRLYPCRVQSLQDWCTLCLMADRC